MLTRKQYLFAAIGALALIGVGTLLSPQRSEAQFASPVRVANSSAAPALNSRIDDHGRIPFVSGFSNSCSGTLCSYTFPTVPAGRRVVIEHISGNLNFNAAPTVITMFVNTATTSEIQFNVPPGNVGTASFFDQPLLYYVDGGQSPVVIFTSFSTNFAPGVAQNLTLVGYELDCNAAPCAAIATR